MKFEVLRSGPTELTLDLSRGADVTSYVDDRLGGEILWVLPDSGQPAPEPRELGQNTQAFYDNYRGGIQELFPNTADATTVLGAELPFHGELCQTRMSCLDRTTSSLTVSARLKRYPVQVTKSFSIASSGDVTMTSLVENLSSRELPYSWGFHPVFSDRLTGPGSLLWVRATGAKSHPSRFANRQKYAPGEAVQLEEGSLGNFLPLSPAASETADLVYVDLLENSFQLGSPGQNNLVLRWSNPDFNQLWVWQECHGQDDWPWWGQHHVVGIEPHTSSPATSLAEHIERGTHRVLPAHSSAKAEFLFSVVEGPM